MPQFWNDLQSYYAINIYIFGLVSFEETKSSRPLVEEKSLGQN